MLVHQLPCWNGRSLSTSFITQGVYLPTELLVLVILEEAQ